MVKILSIAGKETDTYTMWYRFSSSIKQKIIFVNGDRVKPTDNIVYICPSCGLEAKTILRTFNDRLGNYKNFDYMCKSCVDKNHDLTNQAKKQLITKTKNKSRPKDIIERTGKLGYIGKNQSKNSEIREKMERTKEKNNSNTKKGTLAYKKRLETYKNKSKIELEAIKNKCNITKEKNGTTTSQKIKRGETVGFINCDEEKRKEILKKIKISLKSIQENGKSLMSNVSEKRVKKMREDGKLIKLEEMSDFQIYKMQVNKITNRQHLNTLENFEKRGRADINKNAFHLDHKFSIKEGFLNNIPTYIIGDISNLEMIPHSDNCSKNYKCSISLENLYAACHL